MPGEESCVRVLVVGGHQDVTSVVRRTLSREGYDVAVANDGDGAKAQVMSFRPGAFVLDMATLGADGIALCREIRGKCPDAAILMVTVRDARRDQVIGPDAGADDYLVKPFSLQVLVARLHAALRRRQPRSEVLTAGDLELDTASRRARRRGRTIDLTATECRLLSCLMRSAGQPIPKHELTQRVWGYDFEGTDNVLEVYIAYLRAKLEAEGEPRVIHTLRGIGYELRPFEQ